MNLKGSFQFEWGTQRKSGDSFWFSKAFQDIYNSESIWSKGCSNTASAPLLYEGKQQVYRGELYLEGTINHSYLPKRGVALSLAVEQPKRSPPSNHRDL